VARENSFVLVSKLFRGALEHDPEKWKPVFSRDKRQRRLRGDHALSESEKRASGSCFRTRQFTDHARLKCFVLRSHPVEVSNIEFNGDCEMKFYVCFVITIATGSNQ
jgi:hypothetical protein